MNKLNMIQSKINKLMNDINLNSNSAEELEKMKILSNLQRNITALKNQAI